jgi:hypothetical protein
MPFISSAEYSFAFSGRPAAASGLVTSGLVIQLDFDRNFLTDFFRVISDKFLKHFCALFST